MDWKYMEDVCGFCLNSRPLWWLVSLSAWHRREPSGKAVSIRDCLDKVGLWASLCGDFLHCINWCAKTCPLWVAPYPRQGIQNCIKRMELSTSKSACVKIHSSWLWMRMTCWFLLPWLPLCDRQYPRIVKQINLFFFKSFCFVKGFDHRVLSGFLLLWQRSWPKATWGGRVCFIFALSGQSLSLRAGDKNLEAGTEVEAMEEGWLLTSPSWLGHPAFFYTPGQSPQW